MCAPLALAGASLAMTAAGAIASHRAQNKQAKADNAAANQTRIATTQAANESADLQNKTLDQRLSQEQQASDLQLSQNARAGRQSILAADRASRMATAQSRVSAGAAGVSGVSVDALVQDISRQQGETHMGIRQDVNDASSAINTNLSFVRDQIGLSRLGIDAERRARINSVANLPTTPGANPFMTGLQIGGALVDFGNTVYKQRKP